MKDYDTTVARIAGNILSGRNPSGGTIAQDAAAVQWAVTQAFAIVEEVKTRCRAAVNTAHAADLKKTRDWLDEHARVPKA